MGKGNTACGAVAMPSSGPGELGLPGLRPAALELADALRAGEKVFVFSDYDPDGTCGAAALALAFDQYAEQITWGYASAEQGTGLSEEFVRQAAADGASTLITVDLGSSHPAQLQLASELGLRTIVTDHHSVHPDSEPDHHLNPALVSHEGSSGAVVAYKLAVALEEELYGSARPSTVSEGAFLASFGARADMMDMKLPDNLLLEQIGQPPPGLMAAAEALSLKSLAPSNQAKLSALLNLPKRTQLAAAADVAQILSAPDKASAKQPLERLMAVKEACNQASKDFVSQAAEQISAQPASRVASAVIFSQDAYLYCGYSGIASMRMSGACQRPTVVFIPMDEQGSCYKYSVRWMGKHEQLGEGVLESLPALRIVAEKSGFSPPGGHPQAMGGICHEDDIEAVTGALEEWAKRRGLKSGKLPAYEA